MIITFRKHHDQSIATRELFNRGVTARAYAMMTDYCDGLTTTKIGERYGISDARVWQILWREVRKARTGTQGGLRECVRRALG